MRSREFLDLRPLDLVASCELVADALLSQPRVGVCLCLGPVSERNGVARKLATELIHRADTLMYGARESRSDQIHSTVVKAESGELIEIGNRVPKVKESRIR